MASNRPLQRTEARVARPRPPSVALAMTTLLGAVFKGFFSILALVIGGGIIVWVLYNEVIGRLPEYHWAPLIGVFGIAPTMILVGMHWGRQALRQFRRRDV